MNFIWCKLFPGWSKKRDEQAQSDKRNLQALQNLDHFIDVLFAHYDYYRGIRCINLDSEDLASHDIILECLSLDDHGRYENPPNPLFFSPMKLEDLRLYFMDMDDPETQDLEQCAHLLWSKNEKVFGVEPCKNAAAYVNAMLGRKFETYVWNRTGETEGTSLKEVAGWVRVDWIKLLHRRKHHWHHLFDAYEWHPQEAYKRNESSHVMFTMQHEYTSNNDSLLLGELRAIIMIMLCRLDKDSIRESFPYCNVVPILVFSYLGDKQGRILQAHFGHEGLVIRKSKLYDFSDYNNAQKHMELFLQHMTCKVQGPIVISDPVLNAA